MPHSGEALSITGTLRGEGEVRKRDNSLIVVQGDNYLTDENGVLLTDEFGLLLTDE